MEDWAQIKANDPEQPKDRTIRIEEKHEFLQRTLPKMKKAWEEGDYKYAGLYYGDYVKEIIGKAHGELPSFCH